MKRAFIFLAAALLGFAVWKIQSRRHPPIQIVSPTVRRLDDPDKLSVAPPPPKTDWSIVVNKTNSAARRERQKNRPVFLTVPPSQPAASAETPAPTATPTNTNPNRQDPFARVALSMVGLDPEAENYWADAINDPTLSDKEREDLIEDLNEVGFADPDNPTLDELPLIVNRLQIIEQYAPFSMDDNNARSFAEAYKDLVNMYTRLTSVNPPN